MTTHYTLTKKNTLTNKISEETLKTEAALACLRKAGVIASDTQFLSDLLPDGTYRNTAPAQPGTFDASRLIGIRVEKNSIFSSDVLHLHQWTVNNPHRPTESLTTTIPYFKGEAAVRCMKMNDATRSLR